MTDDSVSPRGPTRRDVLRTSGALGGVELLGLARARTPDDEEDSAPPETHVVEVGQEVAVADDADTGAITRHHMDSAPPYRVDRDAGRLTVPAYSSLSEASVSRLEEASVAVRTARPRPDETDTVTAEDLPAYSATFDSVPRALGPAYRYTDRSRLDAPLTLDYPAVTVDDAAVRVVRDEETFRLEPGAERSFPGPETQATFETRRVTEERVERPGFSDGRRPLKTVTGTLETTVVPTLRVRNLGVLTVERAPEPE